MIPRLKHTTQDQRHPSYGEDTRRRPFVGPSTAPVRLRLNTKVHDGQGDTTGVSVRQKFQHWLYDSAFPFWAENGFDPESGIAWEALSHDGSPRADIARRLRVQARQSYCFAISGDGAYLPKAEHLFRFAMEAGFDADSGNLVASFDRDLRPLSAPHDLYDLAFMILAAGALLRAGVDVEANLDRLEQALARLKADAGWHEDMAGTQPRRQNPHMHLFEASIAIWQVTQRPAFRAIAEECLALFQGTFLQENGVLYEFFDTDWTPVSDGAQSVEPGHLAEWLYLVDQYERVFDCDTGLDFVGLFAGVHAAADPLLPDAVVPDRATRRLWPQTEYFKAALTLQRRGVLPRELVDLPEQILSHIWADYFEVECQGGWYDQRSPEGALVSDLMPSSSFYHILGAIQADRFATP